MTLTPDDRANLRKFLLLANSLHVVAVEFVNDWYKGDFVLPHLAECDADSIAFHCEKYRHAADLLVPLIERLLKENE